MFSLIIKTVSVAFHKIYKNSFYPYFFICCYIFKTVCLQKYLLSVMLCPCHPGDTIFPMTRSNLIGQFFFKQKSAVFDWLYHVARQALSALQWSKVHFRCWACCVICVTSDSFLPLFNVWGHYPECTYNLLSVLLFVWFFD